MGRVEPPGVAYYFSPDRKGEHPQEHLAAFKGIAYAGFKALYAPDKDDNINVREPKRAIKPVVIGRKNWMFAGRDSGGETLAAAMTVIETAKLSGLDPQADLADVFARIQDHKINRLDELLPWNWAPLKAPAQTEKAA